MTFGLRWPGLYAVFGLGGHVAGLEVQQPTCMPAPVGAFENLHCALTTCHYCDASTVMPGAQHCAPRQARCCGILSSPLLSLLWDCSHPCVGLLVIPAGCWCSGWHSHWSQEHCFKGDLATPRRQMNTCILLLARCTALLHPKQLVLFLRLHMLLTGLSAFSHNTSPSAIPHGPWR